MRHGVSTLSRRISRFPVSISRRHRSGSADGRGRVRLLEEAGLWYKFAKSREAKSTAGDLWRLVRRHFPARTVLPTPKAKQWNRVFRWGNFGFSPARSESKASPRSTIGRDRYSLRCGVREPAPGGSATCSTQETPTTEKCSPRYAKGLSRQKCFSDTNRWLVVCRRKIAAMTSLGRPMPPWPACPTMNNGRCSLARMPMGGIARRFRKKYAAAANN